MKKYVIINECGTDELIEKVNSLIKLGYEPIGTLGYNTLGAEYFQAMLLSKNKKEKEEGLKDG